MKAHRIDTLSLTFGLIFLAVVASALVARTADVRLPTFGWFVAGGLITLGVLGLLASLRSRRNDAAIGAEPEGQPFEPLKDIDEI